jgi:hypothetical protein
VRYDLIGKLAEQTQLMRATIAAMLTGITTPLCDRISHGIKSLLLSPVSAAVVVHIGFSFTRWTDYRSWGT